MKNSMIPALALGLAFLFTAAECLGEDKTLTNWPSGASPKEVGQRVAEHFLEKAALTSTGTIYPTVCSWYGALTFAQLSLNRDLSSRLIERFDQEFTTEVKEAALAKRHVDYSILGAVPLEIYIESRKPAYLERGQLFADHQWDSPTADGLSGETRFWIDDMYMITLLEVQAYRATGDSRYIDRAALEMETYLGKLQQRNGLFYHAPDTPFYWGRGNGWVAAGMTELLRSLPENHPRRARIVSAYQRMMKSLLKFQGKDGLWRQLIDHPEAWPETSSTAMFTFAMITGVKEGWLHKKAYGRAARQGWLGLVGYLDRNSDLKNVCEGTGKKNDLTYYLERARNTGDLHGQAPLLWCASALLR